jgi:hypothetical protein
MERHRLVIGLTGVNVVLGIALLVHSHRVFAAADSGSTCLPRALAPA